VTAARRRTYGARAFSLTALGFATMPPCAREQRRLETVTGEDWAELSKEMMEQVLEG
jgi:hypothetical protein